MKNINDNHENVVRGKVTNVAVEKNQLGYSHVNLLAKQTILPNSNSSSIFFTAIVLVKFFLIKNFIYYTRHVKVVS